MTTGVAPGARDPHHVVASQVGGREPRRLLGEGAVAAAVAAQLGEGDEDLRRVGHAPPEAVKAPRAAGSGELVGGSRHEIVVTEHGVAV